MEDEVSLLADQAEHFVEVHALETVDVVMQVGADRAFGVEEAHGRILSKRRGPSVSTAPEKAQGACAALVWQALGGRRAPHGVVFVLEEESVVA